MNQTHWIPESESTQQNLKKISSVGIAIVVVITVIAIPVSLVIKPLSLLPGIAAGLSFALVRSIRNSAEQKVLTAIGGIPASEEQHARLFNVVEGLCVVSGDHRPALVVVQAEFPVALAVGYPGSDGTIAVSTGFCEVMDRVETEAVMAHLLWRMRTNNAALSAYLISFSAFLSKIGLGAIARRVVAKMSDESHIMLADIAGCEATRYPPAMESSLEKCLTSTGSTGSVACPILWFAVPDTFSGDTAERSELRSLGFSYPSLPERIAVLKEI